MAPSHRIYDVIIYGATGYTGELTARYFAKHIKRRCTWNIAGRSAAKLAQLRERLAAIDADCARLDPIVASTEDEASVRTMAEKAKVVINAVGPFRYHGELVVKSCVEAGTDYADVNGEPEFIRRMFASYGQKAEERGVVVALSCGADSVPADIGALYAKEQFPAGCCSSVKTYVLLDQSLSDGSWEGISAGTWTTLMNSFAYTPPARPKAPAAPAGPAAAIARKAPRLPMGMHTPKAVGHRVVPFPVADPTIVKKTHELTEGNRPDFAYGHYLELNSLWAAIKMAAAFMFFKLMVKSKGTLDWLIRRKPEGYGPDEAMRERLSTRLTFEASGRSKPELERDDTTVVCRMNAPEAYEMTAILVAQCALSLVEDRARLPRKAGVLTPGAAFGTGIVDRLRQCGVTLEVVTKETKSVEKPEAPIPI
eukprot:tig00001067_g6777.t1